MLLERQLSSAGCSTSYATTSCSFPHLCSRRGLRSRCAAQSRPYRGSHSPERESPRRRPLPYRTWTSGAASAAAVAPASTYRSGAESLDPGLVTSIPDALPCLEDLQHLQRARRPAGRDGSSASSSSSSANGPKGATRRWNNVGEVVVGASSQPHPALFQDTPPPDAPAMDPPFPSRGVTRVNPPQPSKSTNLPPAQSALSQAVPPSSLSAPRSGHPAPNSRGSPGRTAFAPRREWAEPPVMQLTMSIKKVDDWRKLPDLLAKAAPGGLDPFNAAAFLTHLAQRVAASPPRMPAEVAVIEGMQMEALAVVEDNLHGYKARQVSNLTWALARLGLPSGADFVGKHLVAAAYPLLPWYETQHLSNTLWSFAAIGVAPDDEWLEEYLTVAFVALQRRAYPPRHLSNVLWALERLGIMPDQEWMTAYYDCVTAAAHLANGQDCSNTLSSLALLGMHEHKPQATAALAGRLAARLQDLLNADNNNSSHSHSSSASSRSRSGAGVAATAAVGVAVADDGAILTPTPTPIPANEGPGGGGTPEPEDAAWAVSNQALANSLWALAVMGQQPSAGLWDAVASALRLRLVQDSSSSRSEGAVSGIPPQSLAIILWAATTLRKALPNVVMGMVYDKTRAAAVEVMEPRNISTMVWAVASAPPEQLRPSSEWVTEVVASSLRRVPEFGSQAVSNMLYGLCELKARPSPSWMSAIINRFHRDLSTEASGQSVSNVIYCLAKMGYRLNTEGMDILFGLVQTRLAAWHHDTERLAEAQALFPRPEQQQELELQQPASAQQQQQQQQRQQLGPEPPFNSQELSNILYSAVCMGYRLDPAGPLPQLLLEATRARLLEANAQELSTTIWSLAKLKVHPSDTWVNDFCAAAEARLPSFRTRDLAQTLYSAAKLRLPFLLTSPQPQELSSITTTAISTLQPSSPPRRRAPGAEPHRAVAHLPAAASWASAAKAAAARLVSAGNPQELSNLAWALVEMDVPVAPDSPFARAFTDRLVALSRTGEPALLALGVWALGKWRVQPSKPQMDMLEVATFRRFNDMRPHELAAMLSGFAGIKHVPPSEWLEEVMQVIAARSKEFGPQDWTVVLYSLARLHDDNAKPQLEELLQRLHRRLHRLPLPSVILLAYTSGCMGPGSMASALVERCLALLSSGQDGALAAASGAGDAENVAAGGPGARQQPSAPRREDREREAQAEGREETQEDTRPVALSSLTPEELSAVMWAAVRVGLKPLPAQFSTAFFSVTKPLLKDLPASVVASYLWACGRLRMWLPSPWRLLLLRRMTDVLDQMRPRELGMCLAGLMWLRVWPSEKLLAKLGERFLVQRQEMPERLCEHAALALGILQKRALHASKGKLRNPLARRLWVLKTRRGTEAAIKHGKGIAKRPRPVDVMARRAAVKAGVVRRRPDRLALKGHKAEVQTVELVS